MKFNINHCVRIKLTDRGRQILEDQWKEILPKEEYEHPKEDDEGYIEMQLWIILNRFGSYTHMGCDLPFETEIIIKDNKV